MAFGSGFEQNVYHPSFKKKKQKKTTNWHERSSTKMTLFLVLKKKEYKNTSFCLPEKTHTDAGSVFPRGAKFTTTIARHLSASYAQDLIYLKGL